jgi:hypothetical protein
MAALHPHLGPLLDNDVTVFRAFAEKSYRHRKRNCVRYFAFLLREEDRDDGLSVGLTPDAAVRHLATNEGYCQIAVGLIHEQGLEQYGLQVRLDPADENHAFICNLPLSSISDAERERAMAIANELARRARVVTADPHIPAPEPAEGQI